MTNILAALFALLTLTAALGQTNLPTAEVWGSGNPETWLSSGGRKTYPIWVEHPFSFRLEGILANYVTNVVSSVDREPSEKCAVCGGKAHHLCQERTLEIYPRYTLRIITHGKEGLPVTNDVAIAKGEVVTRKETNLVERQSIQWINTWTNGYFLNNLTNFITSP